MTARRILVLFIALVTSTAFAVSAAATTDAAKRPKKLVVVVTNDDGIAGPGLDAIVEALREQPRVTVHVVAPASQQTGAGARQTEGVLTGSDAETLSGFAGTAVDGYPRDTVTYALDELGLKPGLVVSGINPNQNFGPGLEVSGTVGAAREAAARGVPAVAVSQGVTDADPDFSESVEWFLKWFKSNRNAIAKARGTGATSATSINVPTCLTGEVRGFFLDAPVATEGDYIQDANEVNCESTVTDPPDDITAFNNGYATVSEIPAA